MKLSNGMQTIRFQHRVAGYDSIQPGEVAGFPAEEAARILEAELPPGMSPAEAAVDFVPTSLDELRMALSAVRDGLVAPEFLASIAEGLASREVLKRSEVAIFERELDAAVQHTRAQSSGALTSDARMSLADALTRLGFHRAASDVAANRTEVANQAPAPSGKQKAKET